MTNALRIESGEASNGITHVRLYTTETKYEEYTIKLDTPHEMYKELILKIREANQKLLMIKKTVALCRDLQVLDPFSINKNQLIEFFNKVKENPSIKTEMRL